MVLKRTGDGWSEDEKASAQEVVARKFHRELPKSLFLTMSDVRPLGVAITTYHHPWHWGSILMWVVGMRWLQARNKTPR